MELFNIVRTIGLTFPGVEASTKYDGSPVLKVGGAFMAGVATDESAEADTIVVRIDPAERELLLEDAPETYYLTDYYRDHPVVLVRLSQIDRHALRDLLSMSYRSRLPLRLAARKRATRSGQTQARKPRTRGPAA